MLSSVVLEVRPPTARFERGLLVDLLLSLVEERVVLKTLERK